MLKKLATLASLSRFHKDEMKGSRKCILSTNTDSDNTYEATICKMIYLKKIENEHPQVIGTQQDSQGARQRRPYQRQRQRQVWLQDRLLHIQQRLRLSQEVQ